MVVDDLAFPVVEFFVIEGLLLVLADVAVRDLFFVDELGAEGRARDGVIVLMFIS